VGGRRGEQTVGEDNGGRFPGHLGHPQREEHPAEDSRFHLGAAEGDQGTSTQGFRLERRGLTFSLVAYLTVSLLFGLCTEAATDGKFVGALGEKIVRLLAGLLIEGYVLQSTDWMREGGREGGEGGRAENLKKPKSTQRLQSFESM
jgi:hypothetical protein